MVEKTLLLASGAPRSSSEFLVTGSSESGYETIADAISAVNTAGGWTFLNPAKIKILTRSISMSAGVTLPQFCSLGGENVRVKLTAASGACFTLSGFNRLYGLEYVGGNASNTDFFIDSGDTTDNSIINCNHYGNETDGVMKFLRCVGANWARVNLERCLINFKGASGYAIVYSNTGPARYVGSWIDNIFADAFTDFSTTGQFGGNINVIGACEYLRIKRSTIRGRDTNYTGLRIGTSGAFVTLSHNNFDSVEGFTQTGYDIYSASGTTISDAFNSSKRALINGTLSVRGTLTSPA